MIDNANIETLIKNIRLFYCDSVLIPDVPLIIPVNKPEFNSK